MGSWRIFAGAGSSLTGERVAMAHFLETGVIVGTPATVTLTDTVLADVRGAERDGSYGRGFEVWLDGVLSLERAWVTETHLDAIANTDAGGELRLVDVVVTDTDGERTSGTRGLGIALADGAHGSIERVYVARSRTHGVRSSAPARPQSSWISPLATRAVSWHPATTMARD